MNNSLQHLKIEELLSETITGEWGRKASDNQGVKVIRTTNFTNDGKLKLDIVALRDIPEHVIANKKLKYGDIILEKSGGSDNFAVGRVVYFDVKSQDDYLCNNFTQILRVNNKKANSKYVFYYLFNLHKKGVIENYQNKTTGIRNLQVRRYLSQKIPIPPLSIQRKIAAILEKAESAIEKRREANRLTDEFLKSAFLEMFGDPVKNTKKLSIVRCGDISTHVSSGSTPLGGEKTYLADGILFIRSQNVQINRLDLSDVAYISDEVHQKMKRTWVKNGDVLLNITGASIGRVAYFNGKNDTANVNQHVCIIRPQRAKILPEYLSFLISMPNYQKKIFAMNAGATRQAFNFEQIKKFEIPFATLSKQQKFAELVQKVEKLKEKQSGSENELNNLFNSLMQRAFRGELV